MGHHPRSKIRLRLSTEESDAAMGKNNPLVPRIISYREAKTKKKKKRQEYIQKRPMRRQRSLGIRRCCALYLNRSSHSHHLVWVNTPRWRFSEEGLHLGLDLRHSRHSSHKEHLVYIPRFTELNQGSGEKTGKRRGGEGAGAGVDADDSL